MGRGVEIAYEHVTHHKPHEHRALQLLHRLGPRRDSQTRFFVFADTGAAARFEPGNGGLTKLVLSAQAAEAHGLQAVRTGVEDAPTEIASFVRRQGLEFPFLIDIGSNSGVIVTLNNDMVQEVKVQSSNFAASVDVPGGVVNILSGRTAEIATPLAVTVTVPLPSAGRYRMLARRAW